MGPTANDRPSFRARRLNSYFAYSVGCAVAWGVVWILVESFDPKRTVDHVGLVFLGWVIGWVSATIARAVYPPPKKRS